MLLIQVTLPLSLLLTVSARFDFNLHLEDKIIDPKANRIFKWSDISQLLRTVVYSVANPNLRGASTLLKNISISRNCEESLLLLVRELGAMKGWAVEMVDASGKIPGGILEGTVMDFGSLDECIKIKVNSERDESELFRGRYCLVGYHSSLFTSVERKLPDGKNYTDVYGQPPTWAREILANAGGYLKRVAFWFGTCIPSTCSEDDLWKISRLIAMPLGFNVSVTDCQEDKPYVWPSYSIAAVSVLGCLVGLCSIGTLVDVIQRWRQDGLEEQHILIRLPMAFSLWSNTETLFSSTSNGGCLGCLNGIRFLSATWIVLGHTYFYTDTWKYLKYRRLMGFQEQFNGYLPLAVIENFTIPVGSFFFMSGFLLVYTTWRKLEKSGGKLNFLMFLVHKYWRMTPALALTIALLFALPVLDSGPIWNTTLGQPLQQCRDLWWANLLYINNWWKTDEYCLIHTWYLAALMQFHILGALLLFIIYRWPVIGVFLGSLITAGCATATALLVVWNNYPMPAPGLIKDMDSIEDYNSHIYVKSFYHFPCYMSGMVAAYFILKYHGKQLPLRYRVLGWSLAIVSALLSVYGLYGKAEHVAVRVLYIIGHRIGWTAAIGWMTYACASGIGGVLNRFLSWNAMAPLGQLSYLTYLLHPLVIIYRNASVRERVYYGHTELVFSFLSTLVFSLFLAYVGCITLEIPFGILEKIIFGKRSKVNLNLNSKKSLSVCAQGIKKIDP